MTAYTIEITKNYKDGNQVVEMITDTTDRHEEDVRSDYKMLVAMNADMFDCIESCYSEIVASCEI